MSTQGLTSARRGLAGSNLGGLRDLVRPDAPRCFNRAAECHHVITTDPCVAANGQHLCKPCHKATETHGTPSGFRPPTFADSVKNQMDCEGYQPSSVESA